MDLDTSDMSQTSEVGEGRSLPDTANPDTANPDTAANAIDPNNIPISTEPKPSYVKLAMRNMVKKRGLSLQHFFLTTIALLAVLVGLSYLTR